MSNGVRHWLRVLFRRKAVEAELDDELRFHLEQQAAKHQRGGLSPEAAARQARLELGGLEQSKEAYRQAAGISLIESTLQDLRYALRGLRRDPGFSAVIILSLALGIGANTAIFTLMDAVLWKSLPVARAADAARAGQSGDRNADAAGFRYQEFRHLRQHDRWLGGLAAYAPVRINVSIGGQMEPTAAGQLVSGGYFALLGVKAIAGRTLGPEDDRLPDAQAVAMISDGYWQRRFGRDPGIVGRPISSAAGRSRWWG